MAHRMCWTLECLFLERRRSDDDDMCLSVSVQGWGRERGERGRRLICGGETTEVVGGKG